MHRAYNTARTYFLENPNRLIALEKFFSDFLVEKLNRHLDEIVRDYDEANYLYPFWQNYPPDDRGRQPVGDQYPWIEVGEHAIGTKLARFCTEAFKTVRDTSLPTGADERFVISDERIKEITKFTDSVWAFVDIKSVGPRDDFEHTVMSHNQISGDGCWVNPNDGVKNTVLTATGSRTTHPFHCSVPPLYILSDGTIAPVVLFALKPTYTMLSLDSKGVHVGQPLKSLTVISIPNGLLLTMNPAYLKKYPSLLFPGKDDKDKNPLKVRARISFEILRKISDWRVRKISVAGQTNQLELGNS